MAHDAHPAPLPFRIKICGLSTADMMQAALDAGADMVGLVFHPRSPRFVTLERAAELAEQARGKAGIVALVVDFDERAAMELVESLQPDWLQLHGTESIGLTDAIRKASGPKVIKALPVSGPDDLEQVSSYIGASDLVLLDAKPPQDAAYPGGHGRPFDWDILKALDPALPFMLSGGLDPGNVADAIRRCRRMGVAISGVDVSSGVESAPGVKDIGKIGSFIMAAREAAGEALA